MGNPAIELLTPTTPALLDDTRGIFREYAEQLGVDLCFQGFDDELSRLPADYAAPQGALLLAYVDGVEAGCRAMRPLAVVDLPNAWVNKRGYELRGWLLFRRFGLGRLLAQALMDRALQAGHSVMLLDTLDDMEAARGLYASLGFEEVPPYYYNPIAGAHYLKAQLEPR